MRVVMVGHEGVGKTTYMSSMYREMATSGFSGFWVRAHTDPEHRRLMATAERVARAQYPPPSEQRSSYNLTLRHGGNALIDFSWGDYRGGVLREGRGAQTMEFLEDAMAADAVLMFIESGDLVGRHATGRAKIRDLTNVAFQIIDGRERLVPLVLVITKSDLIEQEELPIGPLEGFLDAVRGDQRVRATIAPIVCGPESSNLLLPVMFSLYFGVLARAAELHNRAEMATNAADQLRRMRSVGDWVTSRIKGELTYGELDVIAQQQAQEESRALLPLIEPVQALDYMLSDIAVF
jgi:Double-GTPase 2